MRGCNIKEFHGGVVLDTGVKIQRFLVPFEIFTAKSKLENKSNKNANNFPNILVINFTLRDLKKKLNGIIS